MIVLRADNRVLVANAKYVYLTQNYVSGVSTINVTNIDPIAAEDFILLGEMGHGDSEIFKISSVGSNGDVVLKDYLDAPDTTIHSHPESTKVTVLPYNQIRFFRTPPETPFADETPTFSDTAPLDVWTNLDPTSYYSVFEDNTYSDGFGWFEYRNTETSFISQESNPIPYVGFQDNTVLSIFNDFDSMLNVNELKLVSLPDKFSWFNEGLSLIKNKLNLNNVEFTRSTPQTINIVAGTSEYQLPADFSDLVEIVSKYPPGSNPPDTPRGSPIPNISSSKALAYGGYDGYSGYNGYNGYRGSGLVHYIRGRYIGFLPVPITDSTVEYTYRAKATRATSLSTYIILPDNMFYTVKDWMLYRAYTKFNSPLATSFFASFNTSLDLYIQASVKRTANLDVWDIVNNANT